nr:SH2 motif and Tyrosine protein kinase domain containing protein [Haemonchus contortus]
MVDVNVDLFCCIHQHKSLYNVTRRLERAQVATYVCHTPQQRSFNVVLWIRLEILPTLQLVKLNVQNIWYESWGIEMGAERHIATMIKYKIIFKLAPTHRRMPKSAESPLARSFGATLLKHEYFHGLLPREDVAILLIKHGDFLLRLSEVYFLQLVHIIVQYSKKKCYVVPEQTFHSISDLITYYLNHTMIFRSQQIQLNRGVGLASWEFRADSLQLDQLICMFSCGEVRRGKILRKDTDPTDVAIKTVGGRSQEAKEKIRELMVQCRLLNDLYHPCVVQHFGVCLIGQPNCFVFEYVSDGRLDDWLRAHRNLKRDDLLLMVMSAGWGLEYLHQNTILHRNIAAKNCLYDKQFVKLSGFGKIKKTDSYTMKSSRKMAIKWMAPESIESSVFTQKSDVYGYGILIYEIFAVKEPYEGRSTAEAKSLVILENDRPDFPGHMMNKLSEVVKEKMWAINPEKRGTMRQRSVAAIHQKMDALITKDVELQSLPGFEKTQAKTFVHKKRKK